MQGERAGICRIRDSSEFDAIMLAGVVISSSYFDARDNCVITAKIPS